MPLTKKGKKIMSAMKDKYGAEKGEEVFYASKNKGTISGVDNPKPKKKSKPVGNRSPSQRTKRAGNRSPSKKCNSPCRRKS